MRLSFICIILFVFSSFTYSKETKPIVVLLSIDGFAYEYLKIHQPPNLLSLVKQGVVAKLNPVYPSKTFPNHVSIITGSYPLTHGIINNKFYHPILAEQYFKGAGKQNSSWLKTDPFWTVAEKQGIKTAVYFWPESEAIGKSPTYNIPFNKTDSNKARFVQILKWLKLPIEQRPQFIASYFSSVDSAGHVFGPNSKELSAAIKEIDDLIGDFSASLKNEISHDVKIIIVSDHGMVETDSTKVIKPSMLFDAQISKLIKNKSLVISSNDTQLLLYFTNPDTNHKTIAQVKRKLAKNADNKGLFSIYAKGGYPKHWHLNKNSKLVPDIIIEAIPPAVFVRENFNPKYLGKGTHGYDAINEKNLAGIFIAAGKGVSKGITIKPFENIHVFPFMSELLSIKQADDIDGSSEKLSPYLFEQ